MSQPGAEVLNALLAACSGPPGVTGIRPGLAGLAGVPVFDGSPPDDVDSPDLVAFGLAVSNVGAGGVTAGIRQGWGGARSESMRITCLVQSLSDDAGLEARRRRAFDLLGVVDAVIARDRTLGGACSTAWIDSWVYRPVNDDDGAVVSIEFVVVGDATRFG